MMLPAVTLRSVTLRSSPLFLLSATAGFALVLLFGTLAWQSPPLAFPTHTASYATAFHQSTKSIATGDSVANPVSIQDVIRALFAPIRIKVNQREFTDDEGIQYELPEKTRYNENLGKEILILDLDTRPLPSTENFHKGEFSWRNMDHVSAGVFGHYAYALIHGYDYKMIHAADFPDRHATWIKPSALANHIKDYKFIIFLDADATFRHMHLPVEWMLNYWDIEPKHSITMALDPWNPDEPEFNSDRFNRTYTNTGFMAVQNNAGIMPLLKAWHECPDDTRYPNCSEWKQPRFHEQSAFGEYIRYDFEDSIKELPCAEANGFPGITESNCVGKFIRHYWFDKTLTKRDFGDNVMQAFLLPIQWIFAENTPKVTVQQSKNVILTSAP